jgi:polysaccharide export outer membrane protein
MNGRFSRTAGLLLAVLALAGCTSLPRRADPVAPYKPGVESLDVEGAEGGAAPLVQQPSPDVPQPPGVLPMGEPIMRPLLPGDRLVITLRVYPKTENFESVIDENGTINLDLVGRVKVAGKSAAEAEKAIERAYIDGQFYKTVTASIIPPVREFFVKGYVIRPGNYPISRSKMTVLQALTMAGGWNEFADPTKVRLVRGEEVMILNIPRIQARSDTDVFIEPGDVIDVPKRWM